MQPLHAYSAQKLLPNPIRYCSLEDKAVALARRRKEETQGYDWCPRSPAHFSCHGDIFHTGTSSLLLYLYKEDTVESRMDEVRPPHIERSGLETEGLKTKESVLRRSVGYRERSESSSLFQSII